MATAKISSRVTTFLADKANTTYELGKGKLIAADNIGIDAGGAAEGRVLSINGWVDADDAAIRIGTGGSDAAPVRLNIGEFGKLTSGDYGVESFGDGHVIRNEGQVSGGSSAMSLHGTHTVINSGEINGDVNGLNIFMGEGGPTVIRNTGTISGGTRSIYGSSVEDRVTNAGTLNGDVDLAGGDDHFVFKSGTVNGVVRGGDGEDYYIVKKAGLNIVEDIDDGNDRVRSTISFTLQSNVEELKLLGKKNIDGTGNGSNNELYGSVGRNTLEGGAGFDMLEGGKGNDILTGGVGSDVFRIHRGDGKDIVTDYEAGFDEFEFDSLKGASDFADMVANHIDQKGADLWIAYGDDTIILKNTTEAQLQADDFIFN